MLHLLQGDIIEDKKLKTVSEMPGCSSCKMRELFPDNVFVPPKWGTGKRLVIAEAPGQTETETGEPLTGGSGTWFDICCKKAGLKRDDLTITNVIQCRPPNNVFPTDNDARSYISQEDGVASVEHCIAQHTCKIIDDRKWERLDLLGAKPLEFIAGKRDGIFKWRGSPLPIVGLNDGKPIAIATLHPAFLARDQVMLPVAINDLRKGLQPPPERYSLHPSIEEVRAFKAAEFAFDIETDFWWTKNTRITMVGLCSKLYEAMVVPFHEPYITELKRIFRNAKVLVGHNAAQFDIPLLFAALDMEWSG